MIGNPAVRGHQFRQEAPRRSGLGRPHRDRHFISRLQVFSGPPKPVGHHDRRIGFGCPLGDPTLVVLHLERNVHVRIDVDKFLHDPLQSHRSRQIVGHARSVMGQRQARNRKKSHNGSHAQWKPITDLISNAVAHALVEPNALSSSIAGKNEHFWFKTNIDSRFAERNAIGAHQVREV